MADTGDSLLELKGVVKSFGGLKAADHVSFKVKEGEIRGLIGPNASGKTTIINLISGMYKLNEGVILFSGQRIDRMRPDLIASLGIMRTFQISRVFTDMTVLENMMVPALSQGRSIPEAKRRAEELLEFALLEKLRDEPAGNLSGGQIMLLQIVRGFMNDRLRLYLMDEPFAGVHPSIKGTILNTINTMNREKGMTFLVVSHEMATIRHLCHQITVLHEGRVISQGTMEEVANDPLVIDSYLGG
ncbi:MAG: ABC transporter ATP-binding protein [Deltaproteobacteria bacterium]|nr:ABC transporter ATP-binding protein [Deltaproteobacteria bacterium]